jgi:3-oxoadipate CoA-transferase beta subunit
MTREQMAWRAAQDLPEGAYVNLGIGIPTLAASYVPAGREVIFHSENGILGMGPKPAPGKEDPYMVDAGKNLTTLVTGGCFVHHADAFLMIRGGHLDVSLLGAFEVSEKGDLANWTTEDPAFPPGVGGAMDLAVGARAIRVIMEHTSKKGEPRILKACTYPLTAAACVKRIYTNLAVIDVTPQGLLVIEMVPGMTLEKLQTLTEPKLHLAPDWRVLAPPEAPRGPRRLGPTPANLRPIIHSALAFGRRIRGLALPVLLVCRQKTGDRGGNVEACLAALAAIGIAETPDLAVSRQDHARLCRRAGHFRGQHGHRLSRVRARLRWRRALPEKRVGS